MERWARGLGGVCVCVLGYVLKHTLQHKLGSWPGLSCTACTRISCNSLSYTDRVEGGGEGGWRGGGHAEFAMLS